MKGTNEKELRKSNQKIIELREIEANQRGAYAAQSAILFMLCMIPIILLLLTLVQYTPVTKADVMTAVMQVFPTSVDSMMATIVIRSITSPQGLSRSLSLWRSGRRARVFLP